MEFKEKNSAGKMETWRVEDGVKRKVIEYLKLHTTDNNLDLIRHPLFV